VRSRDDGAWSVQSAPDGCWGDRGGIVLLKVLGDRVGSGFQTRSGQFVAEG
jgi:hypothetical protein